MSTCDQISDDAWAAKRWPGACYFYPARDCPGWAPGQKCGRIGDRIPGLAERVEAIAPYAAAAAAGQTHQARAATARAELGQMLARYEGPVQAWPIELDLRTTGAGDDRGEGLHQAHLICTECRQSVYVLAKDLARGTAIVSIGELTAAVTRHYRESHTDGGGLPT